VDTLLASVLDAHGGLENWKKIGRIHAFLSLGGPFWAARGWPDVYTDQVVTIDPHHEHIVFSPFTAQDRKSVFDVGPERMTIQTSDGQIVEERLDPRASFPMPHIAASTPWDAIQLAYFTSAAVWNYLTAPFTFALPDVEAREIDPWNEDGETWRRLAVSFPPGNANHNADQLFYYDDELLLRRMDYSPDVTGSPPVAHYAYDHRSFDGFLFPTRRRVHLHDTNGVADKSFTPISVDLADVTIERA
jgi:hypothetical protein